MCFADGSLFREERRTRGRRLLRALIAGLLVLHSSAVKPVSATAAHVANATCDGDCDGDGRITIDELLRAVNIALGLVVLEDCTAADADGNGRVTIDELLRAVNDALVGCGQAVTPSPSPTSTGPISESPTQAPTATPTQAPTGTGTSTATETRTPDEPVLVDIASGSGKTGSRVTIDVSLQRHGKAVAAVKNDILFDPRLVDLPNGGDCQINPAIGDGLPECQDDPPGAPCKSLSRNLADCPDADGCPAGSDGLRRLRAIVVSPGSPNPIPEGVVYNCTFTVRGVAGSVAELRNMGVESRDPAGGELSTSGADGSIAVVGAGEGICGNSQLEADEQCDDGNVFGGDGCAANCTNEVRAPCTLGASSNAMVQTNLFAIPLSALMGSETLTFGQARGGEGTIPVVIKQTDLNLDPILVPGLLCACVRGGEGEGFGPGNVGVGQAGCGPEGLAEVDYVASIDHNLGDIDPTCRTGELEEGSAEKPHLGVCNGELLRTFVGGGARGAMFMDFMHSISLIEDGGLCERNCGIPDNGPDCIPCTDDDLHQVAASPLPLTTGRARGKVLNANDITGRNLEAGVRCGEADCLTEVTGAPIDCDRLTTDAAGALTGAALVGTIPLLDTATIGDNVVTSVFSCE